MDNKDKKNQGWIVDYLRFVATHKAWYFLPLAVLLILASLFIAVQTAVVSSPFIYAIF
jgi:hypothetical protein